LWFLLEARGERGGKGDCGDLIAGQGQILGRGAGHVHPLPLR